MAEQATKTISDIVIGKLSQEDVEQLNNLQRQMSITVRLDRGLDRGLEPSVRLEGLTRDVLMAESVVRSGNSWFSNINPLTNPVILT